MSASASQSQLQLQLQEPPLTITAAAHRLGVAAETLRSWQSRYGLGPENHMPGTRRRYEAADMRRLEEFCRLVGAGVAAPEAAKAVLAGYVSDGGGPSGGGAGTGPGLGRDPGRVSAGRVDGGNADAPDSPQVESVDTDAGRAGGGRTLPVGRGGGAAAARGLARCAVRLDTAQMLDVLDTVISQEGVAGAWESTISPALLAVGRKWSETSGSYVEVEHLLSWCVTAAMHRRLAAALEGGAVGTGRGPVLLACAPEESHCLPLEVLNAALAERRVPVRMLGAAVPVEAVRAAARRISPTHVVVWSQTSRTADRAFLPTPGPQDRWVALAAGPGWLGVRPPLVPVLTTLDSALKACGTRA